MEGRGWGGVVAVRFVHPGIQFQESQVLLHARFVEGVGEGSLAAVRGRGTGEEEELLQQPQVDFLDLQEDG